MDPVPPDSREVTFPAKPSTWEFLPWVSTPAETREVGFEQWTTREIDAWIQENQRALGLSPHMTPDGEEWWFALVFNQYRSQYPAPLGSGG